jgi:uncharacterized membrane protein
MKPVKKLTISALVIAMFVVIMFATQEFAFGQYQIRLATSLYSLSYVFPFLVLPLGLANFLSNTVMGGLGPLDMIGGFAAGVLTSGAVYLIRRFKLWDWLIAVPIILIPGLLVPVWLSYILKAPYAVLAVSICIGQIIPGIVGVILAKVLKRVI